MGFKPKIDSMVLDDKTLGEIATGRYYHYKTSRFTGEAFLFAEQMASKLMQDAYPEITECCMLTGEQMLYRQNVLEALMELYTKRNTR